MWCDCTNEVLANHQQRPPIRIADGADPARRALRGLPSHNIIRHLARMPIRRIPIDHGQANPGQQAINFRRIADVDVAQARKLATFPAQEVVAGLDVGLGQARFRPRADQTAPPWAPLGLPAREGQTPARLEPIRPAPHHSLTSGQARDVMQHREGQCPIRQPGSYQNHVWRKQVDPGQRKVGAGVGPLRQTSRLQQRRSSAGRRGRPCQAQRPFEEDCACIEPEVTGPWLAISQPTPDLGVAAPRFDHNGPRRNLVEHTLHTRVEPRPGLAKVVAQTGIEIGGQGRQLGDRLLIHNLDCRGYRPAFTASSRRFTPRFTDAGLGEC